MSPLRRFFAARGAQHPAAYSFITLAAGLVAWMLISVTISVVMSRQAIRENEAREERQAAADAALRAQAAERNRMAVCLLIDRMSAVYNDQTQPTTKTGEAAGHAWQDLYRIFRCDER